MHPLNEVFKSQAVLEDYKQSNFTKGHLAPCSHMNTEEDKEATFTLTNIVPQVDKSNSGPWEKWEEKVKKKIKPHCRGEMYVITGVMPYESNTSLINDRVAVPEYIWSAYCCPTYKIPNGLKDKGSINMQQFFPTYGAVGRNDPNSNEKIVNKTDTSQGYDVREMPLVELENILKERMNKEEEVRLFKDSCKKDKTEI
ncbi:PREDICTED: endonuclease domain-containing 1 protein-like [Cyprinodon variegatus]|uniref:endonuclease domain-containing 1 protein-like n=1 Tax=Cyprinodon variegatus TaxID=28743 RepID=UPI0007428E15|nr:PREDICTED: endonuclease domain-containing 1 protein-like [Cyprinodon variegatus]